MKVLLCTNTFDHVTHGPAKFSNLILGMNGSKAYPDFEIRVLTEDTKGNNPLVHKMTVKLPAFLAPFSQFIRMFLYAKKVRRVRESYPFDVVIYINSFFGLVDSISFKRSYYTVGMINDDNNVDTNFNNFSFSYTWIKRFLFKQLERISVGKHDLIVVNSDYLSAKVLDKYNLESTRLLRLYKSVDLSNTKFDPIRLFHHPIKVLFVKSDFIRGGIQTLAKALALLPQLQFEVTIIGPPISSKEFIESLFVQANNCQLNFLSEQPQEVVFDHMSRCDIFCVPSYKEALGVANIEAIAFGIPVVTSNTGGIPEIVDYGRGGWLTIPGDEHSLSQTIKECIENETARLEKVVSGYDFIRGHFDKKNMFDNLYSSMKNLQQKRRR